MSFAIEIPWNVLATEKTNIYFGSEYFVVNVQWLKENISDYMVYKKTVIKLSFSNYLAKVYVCFDMLVIVYIGNEIKPSVNKVSVMKLKKLLSLAQLEAIDNLITHQGDLEPYNIKNSTRTVDVKSIVNRFQ